MHIVDFFPKIKNIVYSQFIVVKLIDCLEQHLGYFLQADTLIRCNV